MCVCVYVFECLYIIVGPMLPFSFFFQNLTVWIIEIIKMCFCLIHLSNHINMCSALQEKCHLRNFFIFINKILFHK